MRRFAHILPILALTAHVGCKGNITVDEVEVSLSPLSGSQGQVLTLFVTGIGTSFHGDDPVVSFVGEVEGLMIERVNVDGPHRARVRLHITPDAPITTDGPGCTIRVETADQTFDFDFAVLGAPSLPRISLHPDMGLAGISSMNVDVEALEGITFEEGETIVTFPEDSGVDIESVAIDPSGSSMEVEISIADDAPEQSFSVTVTSGSDVATHPFEVIASLGPRLYIDPPGAEKETSADLTLFVAGMELAADDALTLGFPYCPGIDVEGEVVYENWSTALATITITEDAPVDTCQAKLEAGPVGGPADRIARGTFRILPTIGEPFLRLYPSVIERGASGVDITVNGVNTNFSSSSSSLDIVPGSGIRQDRFSASDDGVTAMATLTVASDAPCGSSLFSITTVDEVASALITVIEPTALAVSVTPSEAEQGSTGLLLALNVEGADLTAAVTVEASFPGESGVVIGDVARLTGEVSIDVDPTAPTGITLLTLTVDGESATAPFVINPSVGAPHFTIDPPFLAIPSGEVEIAFLGTATSWDSTYRLFFSDPSIEVVSFTVTGANSATATVAGPAWVDRRRAVAWIASPSDIAGAWWTLLPPGHRGVDLNPVPAEVEAGSVGNIFLALGDSTGFVDGLTVAHVPPGSGLRVSSVDVRDRDWAIVEVDASTEAVPGLYGVSLTTGGEIGLATISVVETTLPRSASVLPEAFMVNDTWNTNSIIGVNTNFDTFPITEVHAAVWEYGVFLGMIPGWVPSVSSSIEIVLNLYPDFDYPTATLPLAVPLEITTDLEVVRASVAVVETATDSYPELTGPLALRPSTSETLVVGSRGRTPPDFILDPPAVTSGGVTVTDVDWTDVELEIGIDVDAGAVGPAELRIQGTGYDWTVVLPVLARTPELVPQGSTTLAAGTRDGTITVESHGFKLDQPTLRSASPGGLLFVDSTISAGMFTADIAYDTSIQETATEAVLFVIPDVSPWCMPIRLDLDPADVSVVSPPSSVLETIPSGGPDDVGFTPGPAGPSFGLWTVLDAGTAGVHWSLIGADGISVLGVSDGGSVAALMAPPASRHYVAVGDGSLSGTDYWISLTGVLGLLTHSEIEPNNDIGTAEGVGGPGSGSINVVVAAIDAPGDRDFYRLTHSTDGPPCWEVVSTRWIAGTFSSPYVSLSLIDDTGGVITTASGGASPSDMDRIVCTSGLSYDDYVVKVEGLAGTTGPYLLVPRWPLVVSEIDHTVAFVELSGKPGYDLSGYQLEIFNGGSCTFPDVVDLSGLGSVPSDGTILVASPGAVPGADIEDAALDSFTVPYALHVCHAGYHTCDMVQVGADFRCPGGGYIDDAHMPAGRLWGLDTDDNAADFSRLVEATPGSPNALPVP